MRSFEQWRIVFSSAVSGRSGVVFIDAPNEAGARAFFRVAFPRSVLLSIALEPVDPCGAYRPRAAR